MESPQVSVQGKVKEERSGEVNVEEGEAQHREGSSTKKIPSCRPTELGIETWDRVHSQRDT